MSFSVVASATNWRMHWIARQIWRGNIVWDTQQHGRADYREKNQLEPLKRAEQRSPITDAGGFGAILSPPHVLEESWNQPQFRNTFDLIDQSLSIQTTFIYIFFISYEDHMNIKYSRTNQLSNSSYCNFWGKVWNCLEIRRLPGTAFKQKIRDLLFRIFDAEDS